jgi:hypothetical protein
MVEVGELCRLHGALYCVDFVSSAFGTPVSVKEWGVDLGLCGTQKVLSLPQDLALVTVSEKAWKAAEERRYILQFVCFFLFEISHKDTRGMMHCFRFARLLLVATCRTRTTGELFTLSILILSISILLLLLLFMSGPQRRVAIRQKRSG